MNERKLELLVEILKELNDLQEIRERKAAASTEQPTDSPAISNTVHT